MKERTFYHESHKPKTKRIDTRIPEALKYRKESICPVCNGTKLIQEFDSRGLRQYGCRACKELSQEEQELEDVANDILEEDEPC